MNDKVSFIVLFCKVIGTVEIIACERNDVLDVVNLSYEIT